MDLSDNRTNAIAKHEWLHESDHVGGDGGGPNVAQVSDVQPFTGKSEVCVSAG
jgi:hypothetical protein